MGTLYFTIIGAVEAFYSPLMVIRGFNIYRCDSSPPSTIFNRKDDKVILLFEYCKLHLSFFSSTLARNLCESGSLKANEVFKMCVTHFVCVLSACFTSCTFSSKLEYADWMLSYAYPVIKKYDERIYLQ